VNNVLKIRNKPFVLSAMQFTGGKSNGADLMSWLKEHDIKSSWMGVSDRYVQTDGKEGWPEKFYIRAKPGTTQVEVGDWIVFEGDGHFSVCPPKNFYVKYDRVDPDEVIDITWSEALTKSGLAALPN